MNRAYATILNTRGTRISQSIFSVWVKIEEITQIFIINPVVKGNPARDNRHSATAAL